MFTGTTDVGVRLADYKAAYDAKADIVTISGRLIADRAAHSVVLIDNQGRPDDEYWFQSYAARLDPRGAFRLQIDKPAKADGWYRILFCFDNGIVTGDGAHFEYDNRGAIRKSYSFQGGEFHFDD